MHAQMQAHICSNFNPILLNEMLDVYIVATTS